MVPLTQVELNITELCNRTCFFCPRAYDYPNLNYHMTPDIAEQAFKQTAPYTDYVTLAGRGEPLLGKYLYEILELAVKYRTRFRIITNGDTLHKHIDEIHKILNLTSTGYAKLSVNCYDGEDQYNEWTKLYKDFSAIEFTTKRRTDDVDNKWWRVEKKQVTNRAGAMPWTNEIALDKPCFVLFHKTFIDYNGDVNLCCHDWKVIESYGNIMKKDFSEIWETGKLHDQRLGLTRYGSRANYTACMECDSLQEEDRCIKAYDSWKSNKVKPTRFGTNFE